MPGCLVPGSGGWSGVGWNLEVHTRGVHRRRLPIPPGSSVIQVSYLSEQVGVSPLPLHEFLWFAEQVCNSLYHSWVWTLVFALTNSCLCRRGGLLRGEHRFRCALVLLLTSSTIGGGGGVTYLFPFRERTARKYPLPGTSLTNPLVKCDEFGASLPTM